MPKKVATYCRVSVHDNARQTLAKQQQKLQEYCEKNGYEVCQTCRTVGDKSLGYEMFLECLRDAQEKGIDTILMASTNRIAGTVEEMQAIREAYEAAGVAIETLDGSHLPFKPGRLIPDF